MVIESIALAAGIMAALAFARWLASRPAGACPRCGGGQLHPVGSRGDLVVLECDRCAHIDEQ